MARSQRLLNDEKEYSELLGKWIQKSFIDEFYTVDGIDYLTLKPILYNGKRVILSDIYADYLKNDIKTLKIIASHYKIKNYARMEKNALVEAIITASVS